MASVKLEHCIVGFVTSTDKTCLLSVPDTTRQARAKTLQGNCCFSVLLLFGSSVS